MGEGEDKEAEIREELRKSLLFKGPTVVAALVCFVAAVFSIATGAAIVFSPDSLEGTFLINLGGGGLPPLGALDLTGSALIVLGVIYFVSAVLLWSEVHWIKGVYAGIIVSIIGMVVSGLATTLAPGIAASGMIINVMIVTLLATETWEAKRGMK